MRRCMGMSSRMHSRITSQKGLGASVVGLSGGVNEDCAPSSARGTELQREVEERKGRHT
jgi:hypothetical protein